MFECSEPVLNTNLLANANAHPRYAECVSYYYYLRDRGTKSDRRKGCCLNPLLSYFERVSVDVAIFWCFNYCFFDWNFLTSSSM